MSNYQDEPTEAYGEQLAKGQAYNLMKDQTVREPLVQRMKREKAQAEREVARLDELIKLLEENPNTQRILELLGRS